MKAYGSDNGTHLSSFSLSEQKILATIIDTIIPAGTSVGALSVGVDKYLQKLVDDCYDKPEQDNVKKQLLHLESATQAAYGKPFTGCTQQQRKGLLEKWAVSQDKNEKDFFDLVKRETIRGFSTSQEVLAGYLNYKVAPGHYYGCVNVTA
jgi:acyl CoA:acetate/3-ketoacid CoA transferase